MSSRGDGDSAKRSGKNTSQGDKSRPQETYNVRLVRGQKGDLVGHIAPRSGFEPGRIVIFAGPLPPGSKEGDWVEARFTRDPSLAAKAYFMEALRPVSRSIRIEWQNPVGYRPRFTNGNRAFSQRDDVPAELLPEWDEREAAWRENITNAPWFNPFDIGFRDMGWGTISSRFQSHFSREWENIEGLDRNAVLYGVQELRDEMNSRVAGRVAVLYTKEQGESGEALRDFMHRFGVPKEVTLASENQLLLSWSFQGGVRIHLYSGRDVEISAHISRLNVPGSPWYVPGSEPDRAQHNDKELVYSPEDQLAAWFSATVEAKILQSEWSIIYPESKGQAQAGSLLHRGVRENNYDSSSIQPSDFLIVHPSTFNGINEFRLLTPITGAMLGIRPALYWQIEKWNGFLEFMAANYEKLATLTGALETNTLEQTYGEISPPHDDYSDNGMGFGMYKKAYRQAYPSSSHRDPRTAPGVAILQNFHQLDPQRDRTRILSLLSQELQEQLALMEHIPDAPVEYAPPLPEWYKQLILPADPVLEQAAVEKKRSLDLLKKNLEQLQERVSGLMRP